MTAPHTDSVTIDRDQPESRRPSPLRLLAAALAGGLGAFGLPGAAHAAAPPPHPATPPAASAPDGRPA